ncbi:MAG: protein-L-isoaspartate(D-aspartate) O-methyltransferase [Candidatus Brocadiia bacterium]|nr:MAG: protein-L-isoaspartate(D-aspartate) O-methyltransferase [Candidatus Brocadiia bacterium]
MSFSHFNAHKREGKWKNNLQKWRGKAIIRLMYSKQNEEKIDDLRKEMVRKDLHGRDIRDPGVLKVMGELAREEFLPSKYRSQAYADGPVPIGMGQTISQPYIVALMTQELRLNPYCEVLEIGTGSGYQTAVLCSLVKRVYTVERYGQLSESAQAVLGRMGFGHVEFYVGDGSMGWPQERTFDRIMVTAAVPELPIELIKQLADGGLLIAPVGSGGVQDLIIYEKRGVKMSERSVCPVRFVKLIGEHGFAEGPQ